MIRVSTGLTGLAFLAVCSVALAADKDASTAHAPSLKTESTIKAATKLPVAAPALFGKPVSLRGTLGAVQVQVNVRPKAAADARAWQRVRSELAGTPLTAAHLIFILNPV